MVCIVLDFDGSFTKIEAMDKLAEICRPEALQQVEQITSLGMDGKIDFTESLRQRLGLLRPNQEHISRLIEILKQSISDSILRNKEFFMENNIYIITGGFREFVVPVVAEFGIPESRVFANSFLFDSEGNVTGFDEDNPLCRSGGKCEVIRQTALEDVYIIGDGYTDYEIYKHGLAAGFIAFTENYKRDVVVERAPKVADNFEEVIRYIMPLQYVQ